MASSHLRKKLECSICQSIYTDPVTLKCGHNFCRVCIDGVLDTQEGSGGYSCPECREEFQERLELQRNITVHNIVKHFLSTPDQDDTGVFCTYCFHTPVPAVISCLLCEASLCDNHLRVHSKSPEHVFCDPTTSLEDRKYSVHKKILEYYCTEDSTGICVSCRLDGEHRGHQVETLDEKKKENMKTVLQKCMVEREEIEKGGQSLEEHRRNVQGKSDGETGVTALFRDLTRDPLTVLQESDTGDLCDTEDGDDEYRERHDKLLHDGGDLDVAGVSHTLHTGLSDIMSGVNVQKCTGTHVYPHSTTKGKVLINAEPSRPQPQPSPTIQGPLHQAGGPNVGAVQKTSRVLGFTDILLDVSTAGNHLHISDDRKTASFSDHSQNRPRTELRFQFPHVLCSQSFSSGRHYWEVDAGGSRYWTVGMCYPSIDRRGGQSLIGYNRKSWGLGRWANQYSAVHDSNKILLPSGVASKRVRIELDYEAGRISFYDLCDPIRHLHTFTTTFTEPLYSGLGVYEGRVNISRK